MIDGNLQIIWSGVYHTDSTGALVVIFSFLKDIIFGTAVVRDKNRAFLAERSNEDGIEPANPSIP